MPTAPSLSPTVFSNDGFALTATEPWFKVKVQLLQSYLQTFIAHVAGRSDDIVFVDLFAGSGLYCHGHKKEIFPSCNLAALAADWPFTKWILCESNVDEARALKVRVNKYFRQKNVLILDHPPEELVDRLRSYVPQSKGSYKVSTLCLVDPFSLDVNFSMIRKLADMGFSFLVPFTFNLNNWHGYQYYLDDQQGRLQRYLGSQDISRLKQVQSNIQFYRHLVRMYQNNMLMLGLNTTLTMHKLDSTLMGIPSYYMGFFSKQISSRSIQRELAASLQEQLELFE